MAIKASRLALCVIAMSSPLHNLPERVWSPDPLGQLRRNSQSFGFEVDGIADSLELSDQ